MHTVESWEVLAVTPEFLEAIKHTPEALFAESITIKDRTIPGSKRILTASSQEEVGVLLPGLLQQSILQERPKLVLVRRKGKCKHCVPDPDADPDAPILNCPHLQQRSIIASNKVWGINVEALLKAAESENAEADKAG